MTGRHRAPGRPALRYVLGLVPGAAAAAWWGQVATPAPTAIAGAPAVVAVHPTPAPRPVDPVAVAVHAALSKVGTPYVWGAKGPDVFDCSGLTQWAWRQAGVRIGEDTYRQLRDGVPVQHVQRGDLVFPHPGHVLLAISDTQAVEAPRRGMRVRVVALPKHYTARRVQ